MVHEKHIPDGPSRYGVLGLEFRKVPQDTCMHIHSTGEWRTMARLGDIGRIIKRSAKAHSGDRFYGRHDLFIL